MPSVIDPGMSVDQIMRRWPATIGVMIRHRMLCIGCPIGTSHHRRYACRACAGRGHLHGRDAGCDRDEAFRKCRALRPAWSPESGNDQGEVPCA